MRKIKLLILSSTLLMSLFNLNKTCTIDKKDNLDKYIQKSFINSIDTDRLIIDVGGKVQKFSLKWTDSMKTKDGYKQTINIDTTGFKNDYTLLHIYEEDLLTANITLNDSNGVIDSTLSDSRCYYYDSNDEYLYEYGLDFYEIKKENKKEITNVESITIETDEKMDPTGFLNLVITDKDVENITDKASAEQFFNKYTSVSGPVISGAHSTYATSVDDPISIDTIKSALTAIDETDGDVTSSIVVKSGQKEYENACGNGTLGSYDIVFEASDKSGNKSEFKVTITILDLVAPVISGPSTLTYSYSKAKTKSDILALYSVTDNHDVGILPTIKTTRDVFNEVGEYVVNIEAVDSSEHKTSKEVKIYIIDDVAPVFSGSTSFISSNKGGVSVNDIKSQCKISATDFIDGACEVIVESDTFTGNATKVGDYSVTFKATDKSGNVGRLVVNVRVNDEIPPVFYIDESVIYASSNIMLTSVDISNLMKASKEVDISKAYRISIDDVDHYFDKCSIARNNKSKVDVGDYRLNIVIQYADGLEEDVTKTISVYDEKDYDIVNKPSNTFKNIGKWFHCLGDTFADLFKHFINIFKFINNGKDIATWSTPNSWLNK